MPRESYAITLTFMPHIKYNERMKRIAQFPKIIRDELKFKMSYTLVYSIEYHKYPINHFKHGQPNPMAPHVHALLQVQDELPQKVINNLFTIFRRKYGRSQFDQLHTEEDFNNWLCYVKKDVDNNNSQYPSIKHYKEITFDHDDYMDRINSVTIVNPYFSDSESD